MVCAVDPLIITDGVVITQLVDNVVMIMFAPVVSRIKESVERNDFGVVSMNSEIMLNERTISEFVGKRLALIKLSVTKLMSE